MYWKGETIGSIRFNFWTIWWNTIKWPFILFVLKNKNDWCHLPLLILSKNGYRINTCNNFVIIIQQSKRHIFNIKKIKVYFIRVFIKKNIPEDKMSISFFIKLTLSLSFSKVLGRDSIYKEKNTKLFSKTKIKTTTFTHSTQSSNILYKDKLLMDLMEPKPIVELHTI